MPSKKITGLTPGTDYDVEVQAGNDSGWSAWSAPVTGTTADLSIGAPPQRISPPAVEYEAPLVNPVGGGLYAAATVIPAPAHWTWGVSIRPINCGNGFGTWDVTDPCAEPDPEVRKIGSRTPPLDPFLPVVTWGYDECDPQETDEQVLTRARQNQRLGEQLVVESTFGQRLLTEAIDLGAVGDLFEAVSVLESELAQLGVTGVLHAASGWAAIASVQSQILGTGAVKRSPLGHAWAFGGGYVDTLDNVIVATGPITVWQGAIQEQAALDAYKNLRAAVVERAVIVGYECAAYKVSVTPAAA